MAIAVSLPTEFSDGEGNWRLLKDRGFWILLLLPLLVLTLNNKWAFTPAEGCDPWVYFGHFMNLTQHLKVFGYTYNSTRLSVVLPGHVAYHFLPPLLANYALRLVLFYASVLSLYLVLSWTVSRRVGLLAAVCLGCQFFFLQAIGWDYVDGFGVTYFLVAALAFTAAARFPFWKSSLVAAGVSCSALVVAHITYVAWVPFLVLHYLFVNRQARRNPFWASVSLCAVGAIGLVLAFSLYNWWVTGRFWFLAPNFAYIRRTVGPVCPWVVPLFNWLPGADWLVLPTLTALGGLIFLWRNRDYWRERRMAVYYQFQFLAGLALLCGWQGWGRPYLQACFYASLLLPATLMAFGSQLAPHVEHLRPRSFGILVGAVLAVVLAPHALTAAGKWLGGIGNWSGLLLVAVGLLGIVFLSRRTGAWTAVTLIGLFVSLPTYVACSTFYFGKYRNLQDPRLRADTYRPADVLRAVAASVNVVQKWDKAAQGRFWYDADAPLGLIYRTVCSTYLYKYRLVTEEFPSVGDQTTSAGLKRGRVWILSADREALARANAALEEHGLEARLLAEEHIAYHTVAYTMSYVAIEPKGTRDQLLAAHFGSGEDEGSLASAAVDDHSPLPQVQWRPFYQLEKGGLVAHYLHLVRGALKRLRHGPGSGGTWLMRLQTTNEGLEVTTVPGSYGYALIYSPLTVAEEGDYLFQLKYTLRKGDITFGALSQDQSRWLGQARSGNEPVPREKPGVLVTSCTLHLQANEKFHLMLANNWPCDEPSEVVVHEVRAFRELSSGSAAGNASRPKEKSAAPTN